MRPTSAVIVASLSFAAFWVVLVLGIALLGRKTRLAEFRKRMLAQWKPALAITALFLVCMAIGGKGPINPYAIGLFCQALVGFAIARSIPNFQPIPVVVSCRTRQGRASAFGRMIFFSILAAVLAFIAGNIGLAICKQVFHETAVPQHAMANMPANRAQLLGLFLAGAGLAEETPYRLVALSLVWWWSGRRRLAVLVSGALFAAYHLTPLSGMYLAFWHYPISQFIASLMVGIVWGWVYIKAGFESAVIAHTLSDWLPVLIFMK